MVKLKKSPPTFFLFLCLMSGFIHAKNVRHIDIAQDEIHNKGRDYDNEEIICKLFKPNIEQISRFFRLAKQSQDFGPLEVKYSSPCIATGAVVFQDGSAGEWMIYSSGLGYVFFKSKELTVFFHKHNPWIDPFACTYGLGDEPEC
ncbi:hypothetical protein [Erwinia oleae]|uniref:hypothetical protein n=1 Tax=Erwinia oleae TaxID=796334 RepID=UPI00126A5D31|nr:hypothetical protein [Erwinia oleae]